MTKRQSNPAPQALDSRFSFAAFSDFVNQNFSLIILLVIAFALGFLSGSLWTENKMLRSGVTVGGNVQGDDAAAQAAAAAEALKQTPKFDPKTDRYRGNKDAKVVMIEYSDFECPFCARFHPTMEQVMDEYGDDVVWVYRHFPLSFHPYAQMLAEVSECVAKDAGNDGFWKFADAVYEQASAGALYDTNPTTQERTVNKDKILALARSAGAGAGLQSCLDNQEMAQLVKDQMAAASAAGISGTPGTVIISKKGGHELVPGALPFDQVSVMLKNHL